jgi:hypothetical protein
MTIEYAYLACGFVVLAIVGHAMMKFDAEAWITKDLKHGDLYSLIEVASGLRPNGLTRDQARRLEARGMVHLYGNGNFRATIKGRLALRIRQAVRQTVRSRSLD